ncbi:MAG: histidine phosphatase family protein, partial [Proteobacteria bacterium]|nr:histidine phosphatase family protein [Pseudomonadota bacterium]
PAGLARAARLATLLADAHIGAVYTSQYVRTHDTGVPTADAAAIAITTRPVDGVADGMELVAAVAAGGAHAVLIVGHSNTVPETVLAFTGTTVAPIAETEYDRLYTITLAPDGPHVVAGTY